MGRAPLSVPSSHRPLACCLVGSLPHRLDPRHPARCRRRSLEPALGKRTALACLPPGPTRNWASGALLNASLAASFCSFIGNARPCVAGLPSHSKSRFPYAASLIGARAAEPRWPS